MEITSTMAPTDSTTMSTLGASSTTTASTSSAPTSTPSTSADVLRSTDHASTVEADPKDTTAKPQRADEATPGHPNLEVRVEEAPADKSVERAAWSLVISLIFGIFVA
ncbi:hypothetical protein L596_010148 [Steinernema carpocapsae]|nr:hypothetical protein L596_010148 [Steinernema carpocapsae]